MAWRWHRLAGVCLENPQRTKVELLNYWRRQAPTCFVEKDTLVGAPSLS